MTDLDVLLELVRQVRDDQLRQYRKMDEWMEAHEKKEMEAITEVTKDVKNLQRWQWRASGVLAAALVILNFP